MLMPRKTKHRKQFRGRRRGTSTGQTDVQYGDYGIKALENGWVTNRPVSYTHLTLPTKA